MRNFLKTGTVLMLVLVATIAFGFEKEYFPGETALYEKA